MKSKLFLICLCVLISACQKQTEDEKNSSGDAHTASITAAQSISTPVDDNSNNHTGDISANPQQQHNAKQAFNTADQKISQLMDRIENPATDSNTRKQILCHDYPAVYQNEYIPALLKLSKNSTQDQLLSEFNFILADYKNRYGVIC